MDNADDASAVIAAIGTADDPCKWDDELSENATDAGFDEGSQTASNIQLFDHRGYNAASADTSRSAGGTAPDGFIAVGNVLAFVVLTTEGRDDLLPSAFDFIVDQIKAAS